MQLIQTTEFAQISLEKYKEYVDNHEKFLEIINNIESVKLMGIHYDHSDYRNNRYNVHFMNTNDVQKHYEQWISTLIEQKNTLQQELTAIKESITPKTKSYHGNRFPQLKYKSFFHRVFNIK